MGMATGQWLFASNRPKSFVRNSSEWTSLFPATSRRNGVSANAPVQKFRLFRQDDCDGVLSEFMDTEPKKTSAIPIWKHPLGAEHEILPFGKIVPCYRSVDLPLAPAF